nr:period circadian protein homolog 2 isoform X2 [Loxodonta africana]
MNGYADFPPSPSDPSKGMLEPEPSQAPLQEDMEMSSGCSGNESNEHCSPGQGSDCHDSKGLGMLVGPPDAHQGPNAFSLMMAKSEHNPSTSGCSSEQSGKANMHKELIKTLKELKVHLPADKKAKGRANTLATLKYALRSVKQVKANEEYYQLLMSSDSHPSSLDVPSYTVEEIESMASEHIVKNVDMFAVAVSLVTGKIVYISNQVASIFHHKRDAFADAKFVEFLAPHDVSVFHSSTTPYKLPSWGTCSGGDSFSQECLEEKSFFCRVSVGKTRENEVHYRPFRMTPYLVKVRDPQVPESQLCCVLLAEKVHSGYEAPRIPPEKRIFTTTHTPNCLFQDVDQRGPLNEDVFAAQPGVEEKAPDPSIQELTEQIYRLLLQEMCKNGNKTKNKSHYSHEPREEKKKPVTELQSRPPLPAKATSATDKDGPGSGIPKATFPEELACKAQPACSYQQVSCLDGVIRYLESCSEAATLKRKYELPADTQALNASDKRRTTGEAASKVHAALLEPAKVDSHTGVSSHLTSLALPGKAESVVSLTSQCSYSSTIVHVGDKKPQPELETIEDAASGAESLDGPAGPALSCSLGPEKEPFKKLGLTKEVLAAHTQKEEQSFLHKFRETQKLHTFHSCCRHYLQERPKGQSSELAAPGLRNASGMHLSWKKPGKNRKLKSKRAKLRDSSGSTASGGPAPTRAPLTGLNATAWSPSDTSQSSCPAVPFPAPVPTYPLPVFPTPGPVAAAPTAPQAGFVVPTGAQPDFAVEPPPFTAPLAPVMAFVLPSYPFPAVGPSLPQPFFPSQTNFPGHPEMIPVSEPVFPSRTPFPTQPCVCPPAERGQPASRAATPATPSSTTGPVGRASPPLFQSRGSSPLQLNLLQLEEAPEGGASAVGTTGTMAVGPDTKPATSRDHPPKAQPTLNEPSEAQQSDALSTSSDLLDLLLNEDLCSATGSALSGSGASATSDSLGSRSLGCTVSRSGTGSSDTSHTSKYFGSVDSSENNHKARVSADVGENEHLIKYVLQDPIWLLMADADNSIMMTYQLPARNLDEVLKEDREKLRVLQKFQPQFTEAQKLELREVHPWVQVGGLPAAMDVEDCVYCENKGKGNFCAPYEEDIPALGLSKATDTKEEESGPP